MIMQLRQRYIKQICYLQFSRSMARLETDLNLFVNLCQINYMQLGYYAQLQLFFKQMDSEELFHFDCESNLSLLQQIIPNALNQQYSFIQMLEEQQPSPIYSHNNNRSEIESSQQAQNKFSKFFYKSKINKLSLEENKKIMAYNYNNKKKIVKQSSENKTQKLKRNRESVKNCRQRRKQYIIIIQKKLQEKEKQIQELTTKLQEVQLQRDRLINSDQTYTSSFIEAQKKTKQNIQIAYEQFQSNPTLLNEAMKEYSQRFGPSGKDRVNLLNYHMSQIVQNFLGDKQKYLINCFAKGRYIFGSNDRSFQLEMKQVVVNFSPQRYQKIYKPILQKYVCGFNLQIQNFYNNYVKLRQICNNFQELFCSMKKQCKNDDIARNHLWFEQNKNRRQLNLKGEWYQVFKGGQNIILQSLKKQKKYC